jgi:hypothetical protein
MTQKTIDKLKSLCPHKNEYDGTFVHYDEQQSVEIKFVYSDVKQFVIFIFINKIIDKSKYSPTTDNDDDVVKILGEFLHYDYEAILTYFDEAGKFDLISFQKMIDELNNQ